jgi:hypothetical protein
MVLVSGQVVWPVFIVSSYSSVYNALMFFVQFLMFPSVFQCDGISLNLADGPALQGISLLNIPSTHGGTNMWGDSKARSLLEVFIVIFEVCTIDVQASPI